MDMTDEVKWCTLCQRRVVPKKGFNSIEWVGFVPGFSYLVAALSNQAMSDYTYTSSIAASLATGVGNIMLNFLLLLVALLVMVSLIYCIYYEQKSANCPICNSRELTEFIP
jgi:hypothetical protein